MNPADFRHHGHALVEWIADYLTGSERHPVSLRVSPGDVRRAFPAEAPEQPEPFEAILADLKQIPVPALIHWNHHGFFGHFDDDRAAVFLELRQHPPWRVSRLQATRREKRCQLIARA